MYFKLLLLGLLSITSAFAEHSAELKTCITHGQCQEHFKTEQATKCLIIKTGVDYDGRQQCALRCYAVTAGSSCKPIKGESFGYCKKEASTFDMPIFDDSDPNRCDNAVSSLVLSHI